MNKTDALLWAERLREGIRLLPDCVKVYGFDYSYDSSFGNYTLRIQVEGPVEWPAVFDGMQFPTWIEKKIALTPHVMAWWSESRKKEAAGVG